MARVDDMLQRLPQLYKDGALVRSLLAVPGVALEVLTQEMAAVQRAHWFDTALERDEVVKLGAALGIEIEPWQSRDEYRAWVHALRNAMLENGAVTKAALQGFVREYSERYQDAAGIQAVPPIVEFSETPSTFRPAFIENPWLRRFADAAEGAVEPLHQFRVVQRGLDPAAAGLLIVGVASGPEFVPVIVNTTTRQGLVFLGAIAPGERLLILPTANGVIAELEGVRVTDRLRSIQGVEPGVPWTLAQVTAPTELVLQRGSNDLWFFPLAHFNERGLDRFLLALPDLLLKEGRFDQTSFDRSLFYLAPAVRMVVTWLERQPASLRVELPGGALRSEALELDAALRQRERLEFSLNLAISRLKAAGVAAELEIAPFREMAPQADRLAMVLPKQLSEGGSTGADRMPDAGGAFEVTGFNDSTFR